MVKQILILSTLLLAGCGDNTFHVSCDDGRRWDNGQCVDANPAPTPIPGEPSILNKWTAINANPIYTNPDFSSQTLGVIGDANAAVGCTGSYGNNIVVNTMQSGQMKIQGNAQTGLVQFGNVKYYGMDYTTRDGKNCKNISKEGYIYSIRSQILTLCLVNLAYPYCSTYSVSQ